MPLVIIALVMAAVLGGGVSMEANKALPGDALYPFKIGVNERAEGYLARGDAAKAHVDVELAEARLDEAQALARENKLSVAAQSQLTQNFNAHVAEATALGKKLESQKDYQSATALAISLQGMLKAEVQLLQDASSQGSVARQVSLVPILVEARKNLAAAASTSIDLSAQAVAANVKI